MVRDYCVDYLDPMTLSHCWSTATSFCVDDVRSDLSAVRKEVWRRYLTGWVEKHLCAGDEWVHRLRRFVLGQVPEAIFPDILRLYLFRAGLNVMPWSTPPENAILCAAGSYPLHAWMMWQNQVLPWTPGDVDLYFAHPRGDDDAETVYRLGYDEVIRMWCDRFVREVLKEDPDGRRSLKEITRGTGAYQRNREPGVPVAVRRNDVLFDIAKIRNFTIIPPKPPKPPRPPIFSTDGRRMMHHGWLSDDDDDDVMDLPIFSFLRWRDHRDTPSSLDHVLESFDIDVCQVGIERNDVPPDLGPYTIDDGDVRLRPLNPRVATAILNRTATLLRSPDARIKKRITKYQQRGFVFPNLTTSSSSDSE